MVFRVIIGFVELSIYCKIFVLYFSRAQHSYKNIIIVEILLSITKHIYLKISTGL